MVTAIAYGDQVTQIAGHFVAMKQMLVILSLLGTQMGRQYLARLLSQLYDYDIETV